MIYQSLNSKPQPKTSSVKIEGLVVCVGFSDILAYTLPNNKSLFNNLVVVTDTKDTDTERLCHIYNVKCVKTDIFYKEGAKFDKGAGINEGLKYLDLDGFVWLWDADIWIHPHSMKQLKKIHLNPQHLYGCDRILIESFKDWTEFIQMPDVFKDDWMLHLSNYKIGSRLTFHWQGEHWHCLGFTQIFNPKGSDIYNYPSNTDASQSDLIFSSLWHRSRRTFLPEIIVVHLEEGESMTGKTWKGRKDKNFKIQE